MCALLIHESRSRCLLVLGFNLHVAFQTFSFMYVEVESLLTAPRNSGSSIVVFFWNKIHVIIKRIFLVKRWCVLVYVPLHNQRGRYVWWNCVALCITSSVVVIDTICHIAHNIVVFIYFLSSCSKNMMMRCSSSKAAQKEVCLYKRRGVRVSLVEYFYYVDDKMKPKARSEL